MAFEDAMICVPGGEPCELSGETRKDKGPEWPSQDWLWGILLSRTRSEWQGWRGGLRGYRDVFLAFCLGGGHNSAMKMGEVSWHLVRRWVWFDWFSGFSSRRGTYLLRTGSFVEEAVLRQITSGHRPCVWEMVFKANLCFLVLDLGQGHVFEMQGHN